MLYATKKGVLDFRIKGSFWGCQRCCYETFCLFMWVEWHFKRRQRLLDWLVVACEERIGFDAAGTINYRSIRLLYR